MKKLILTIFAFLAIGACIAHADTISAIATADNNLSYWTGSSWQALGTNWRTPETGSLTITSSTDYIYFAVSNDVNDSGNPAGFLASFTDTTPGGTFTAGGSTLLSGSSAITVLPLTPWLTNPVEGTITLGQINPPNSPDPGSLLGYGATTSYGANGDSSTIWQQVLGGPITGIDPNAQWVWTANNDQDFSSLGQDDAAYFQVDLGVSDGGIGQLNRGVVPEPPTLLLFAFAGALMMLFFHKRKMLTV